jgi:hypothetical protein
VSPAELSRLSPLYRRTLSQALSEIEGRSQLWLLWIIQAAISGGEGAQKLEYGLIDRAFRSDDAAHKVAYEAASRSYST